MYELDTDPAAQEDVGALPVEALAGGQAVYLIPAERPRVDTRLVRGPG